MSKFYNEIAEKYDYIFPLSLTHQTFFASELCGKTVLDVGAATGNLTAYLLSQGYEVTGIDLSERLITEAAKKGIVVQPLNMLDIDQLQNELSPLGELSIGFLQKELHRSFTIEVR